MKKVININFQGRVIPIEESAFEMLKKYSESLRVYFANEEGKDEIINDIENRIAELFDELLKKGAICITEADVEKVLNSMGRPEDFAEVATEAESTYSNKQSSEEKSYSYTREETSKPRGRLYRDENDKLLGGVCSGLANYLNIDASVVRLIFVFLLFFGGSGFLAYLILWIVVPSKPLHKVELKTRRLYRNSDDRIIGGVCSGLAKYFNIKTWIPRLIFALPLILGVLSSIFHSAFFGFDDFGRLISGSFGSTLFITYIILWIILPEAVTAAEKLEMRGEKVDLQSIKNTVKEEMGSLKSNVKKVGQEFSEKVQEWGNEASGQAKNFASQAEPVIRRTGSGIGNAISILFKAFFLFIAGIIAFVIIAAIVGLMVGNYAFFPFTDFFIEDGTQKFLLWGTLFLFLLVPVIALITWIIRRIVKAKKGSSPLRWTFSLLWVLGWVCLMFLISSIVKNFKVRSFVKEEIAIVQPVNKLYIKVANSSKSFDDQNFMDWDGFIGYDENKVFLNSVRVKVGKSTDSNYHVTISKYSRGRTFDAAKTKAGNISFQITQKDSVLLLSDYFELLNKDKFRNQQVVVWIQVPVGKKIELDRSIDRYDWFNVSTEYNRYNEDFDLDDFKNEFKFNVTYIMTDAGLIRADGKMDKSENFNDGRYRYEDNDSLIIPAKPDSATVPKAPFKYQSSSSDISNEESNNLEAYYKMPNLLPILRVN